VSGLAFADATGTVTAGGIEAALLLDHPYARSLARFGRTVTLRYRALLRELATKGTVVRGFIGVDRFNSYTVAGDELVNITYTYTIG
jgi:hypothetical protein